MEFESFLSYPRWDILKILSEKPSSPLEISIELNTTTAYISQQLKILDAAGLISKTKTGASEKGKPRSLFSLSNDFVYLAFLTKNKSDKKLIRSNDHHSAILKIWTIEDESLHPFFEKLYLKLEENLDKVDAILLNNSNNPRIIIISDSKTLKGSVESYLSNSSQKINCTFLSKDNLKNNLDNVMTLYDPLSILDNLNDKENKNEKN